METNIETSDVIKKRHILVTVWLTIMLLSGIIVLCFFSFFLFNGEFAGNIIALIVNSLICLLNIVFCTLLFNWKKFGFWGLTISSVAGLIINLIKGYPSEITLVWIICTIILLIILQKNKNGISAWANLE
jgi:hypothetical protein